MSVAIFASQLSKTFQNAPKPAVSHLNLQITEGESVAFLGPNGAGKSTTIKMLCGILKPDQGEAKILGHISGSLEANKKLGLVFGARSQLYFHMTVQQSLILQAETYYVSGAEQKNRLEELTEIFEAQHLLQRRVRELSLGERMRCEIIASLIHHPQVILLDEPTIGLDISAKLRLRENLKNWQNIKKTTMLLTSHDLSDVEALCHRCILINKGIKAYDGPLTQVKGALASVRRIRLSLMPSETPHVLPKVTLKGLKEILQANPLEKNYEFNLNMVGLSQVLEYLSKRYGEILSDIHISGVDLEEVIHQHYLESPP